MSNEKELSRSGELGATLMHTAFSILRDNGKEMQMKDLKERIEQEVDFDDWAKKRYEKSGYIRWESMLHFFSIGSVKAGHLIKKKGIWYLTPEGEEALKLGPVGLFNSAKAAYREWKSNQPSDDSVDTEIDPGTKEDDFDYEKIEQIALDGFERYINKKNAYEFQDLVAALLRGMGYHTPFVAPKGKDGGVDVIAYRDPLGTESPRIQVQVKHRQSSAAVHEVRQLMGLLQKEGDVGIFVSTGGFTPDAKSTARTSHIHVELINLSRFIILWQEFYKKLTDEDKSLLPLSPIYFVAKDD